MFSSAVYAFELLFAVCRHQWAPSRECQAAMAQAQERQKELPHAQGQGLLLRGATQSPRSGGCGAQRVERSYSTFKVRRGGLTPCPR